MSELAVGSLAGLAANSYVIDVASGSRLTQPGMVLQVVTAEYGTEETTTSGTYVNTSLSASITPSSTSSKIFIMCSFVGGSDRTGSGNSGLSSFQISRSGSRVSSVGQVYYIDAADFTNRDIYGTIALTGLDSPNTTSATTYTLQFAKFLGSTAYAFWNNSPGVITLMEVAG